VLTDRDVQVIREALAAAIDGPFFPEEEFVTLMGLTRDQMRQVLTNWPNDRSEDVGRGVNNVLLHLGHQHDRHESERAWPEYSSATPRELRDALNHWRTEMDFD
jgi:hypothetical protein